MKSHESESFFEIWDSVSDIFDKSKSDVASKKIIFKLLARYTIEDVTAGIEAHLSDPVAGRFMPRPADIIGKIQSVSTNQWLGADEAWALFPHDESQSACVCDEMLEAFGVSTDLDPIAGRMAFRDTYNRLVSEAKAQRRDPVWKMTLGTDKSGRDRATLEAVEKGKISAGYASTLLPHLPADEIKLLESRETSPQKLIADNEQKLISADQFIDDQSEAVASNDFAKKQLAGIKKALGIA